MIYLATVEGADGAAEAGIAWLELVEGAGLVMLGAA